MRAWYKRQQRCIPAGLVAALMIILGILLEPATGYASDVRPVSNDYKVIDVLIKNHELPYPMSTDSGFRKGTWDFAEWGGIRGEQVVSLELDEKQLQGNLDIRGLSALENLSFSNNNVSALVTGELKRLKRLSCNNNTLTELDVTLFPKLDFLSCTGNKLTEMGKLPVCLKWLACSDNDFRELDLTGLNALEIFQSENTALTRFISPQGAVLDMEVSQSEYGYVMLAGDGDDYSDSIGFDTQTNMVTLKFVPAGNAEFSHWMMYPSVKMSDTTETDLVISFELTDHVAAVPIYHILDDIEVHGENTPDEIPYGLIITVVVLTGIFLTISTVSAMRYLIRIRQGREE